MIHRLEKNLFFPDFRLQINEIKNKNDSCCCCYASTNLLLMSRLIKIKFVFVFVNFVLVKKKNFYANVRSLAYKTNKKNKNIFRVKKIIVRSLLYTPTYINIRMWIVTCSNFLSFLNKNAILLSNEWQRLKVFQFWSETRFCFFVSLI